LEESVSSVPAVPEHISADDFARRLRALVGRGGLGPNFPRRQRDRWILLQAAATQFSSDAPVSEIEATARLGAFLATPGLHWPIDRVALRRALVDDGFVERDPDGTNYRRSDRHRRRVTFEPAPKVVQILGDDAAASRET
jgi:hypothetical protein